MCSGAENFLQMCPHGGLGNHDCTHREDAGVICPHGNIIMFNLSWVYGHQVASFPVREREPHMGKDWERG